MASIAQDNSMAIGNTPLVKLNKLTEGLKATVLAKIEGRNPAFSVKCRIGANMIWDAEKRGVLKPGGHIVEPTSGNTGIALAFVAAARGYKLTITMPESMSLERRKVMTILGADIELTPASGGMKGAIDRAKELAEQNGWFLPGQFDNPANPDIHFKTTGPEIVEATDGKFDIFVAGVGTGGTISGCGRYFKQEKGMDVTCIAVEPEESPVISQKLAGESLVPGPHKIQGIGAGFIPDNLDLSIVDEAETVDSETAIQTARALAQKEGILCGISCGAAVAVALRLAAQEENAGKTIVCILPDLGERYLSSALFAGMYNESGLAV